MILLFNYSRWCLASKCKFPVVHIGCISPISFTMEVAFSMRILFQVICQNHPKSQTLQATSGLFTESTKAPVLVFAMFSSILRQALLEGKNVSRCLVANKWWSRLRFPKGLSHQRISRYQQSPMWCGSTINFANVVVMFQQKAGLALVADSFWDSKRRCLWFLHLQKIASVRWVGPRFMGFRYTFFRGVIGITPTTDHWYRDFLVSFLDLWFQVTLTRKITVTICQIYIDKNDQKLPTSCSFQIWNIHQLSTPRILRKNQSHRLFPFCWGLSLMRLRISRLPIHLMWTSTRIDWISPPINPPADLCEILCSSVNHRCLRIGLESSHS